MNGHTFYQNSFDAGFSCDQAPLRHGAEEMDQPVEGLGGQTERLSCDFPGGGSAFRLWAGGKGEIPDVHAHGGEFHGLPDPHLLRDVQSLPHPAGGAADAGRGLGG